MTLRYRELMHENVPVHDWPLGVGAGKRRDEAGAARGGGRDDVAAHAPGEPAGDREAESEARRRRRAALEAAEDPLALVRRGSPGPSSRTRR